jgi:hypothetical protein
MLSDKNFPFEITHDFRTEGWDSHISSEERIYTIYIRINLGFFPNITSKL